MSSPVRRSSSALFVAGLVASVFLAVWSVKLWAIGRYGSDLPYWDQWAKEGELFYAPWFQHHEFWHNLFVPHNEHRIAPTLAMNLGLLELSGDQWDARVQCVASAALHALLIAGLAGWALRRFRRGWALAGCALLVLIAAPPIAWENVLGGFQSQFYFLAIFSIVAIARLLGSAAFSTGWFLGIASAAVACVSMGSGMLAAAPVAVVAAMGIVRREAKNQRSEVRGQKSDPDGARARDRDDDPESLGDATPSSRYRADVTRASRPQKSTTAPRARFDSVATLIAALLIGGIGWYYRPQAPWHDSIHTKSITETIEYAARCLAWPLYGSPWLAVVFWAPWVVFAVVWVAGRARRPRRAAERHPSSAVSDAAPARLTEDGSPYRATADAALEPGAPSPLVRSSSPPQTAADGGAAFRNARLSADFILAGGLWVLAQIAAVTYSRAGGSVFPASRYGDVCALGLAFNFFALAWLATHARDRVPSGDVGRLSCRRLFGLFRARRLQDRRPTSSNSATRSGESDEPGVRALSAIAALWLLVVAVSIVVATRTELRTDLPQKRSDNAAYIRNTQAFVLTDDYATFAKEVPLIPFPMADWLARILRNPTLRRLLPESVRPPIPVQGLADGAANPAPALLHRATRTVTTGQHWQSPALPAGHGWWKIETAGDCGQPGAVLELVAISDHHVLGVIAPSKPAGDSWRAAYVPAPHEPAILVARVAPPAHWLAFSDPVEMSSLSHWTWRLTLNAWWFGLLAAVGLLGFGSAYGRMNCALPAAPDEPREPATAAG